MIKASQLIEIFKRFISDNWGYIWGTSGVMWTEARQRQLEQTTDADRAMSRKYGKKWIGHMVADCSGAFVYAYRQYGLKIAHGSNTIYRGYCSAKGQLQGGRRTDGAALKPGSAVFVYSKEKNNYKHIGLYIGDGTVVELKGAQAGAVTSKVTDTKWTNWGELKDVGYDVEPGPEPEPEKPTLRKGDSGSYVTLAQTMLIQRGYALPKYGADGKFGNETLEAVKAFQKANGLEPDGVIGSATWAALENTEPTEYYTVTVPHVTYRQAEALCSEWTGATMRKE